MSLFGYPVAHENDAERAVRAALSIQRALAELNRKNEGTGKPVLAARIGLETGPAVVDAAGEIYGDVANVAARVQALAESGAVLVTARVQRQVAGLFVAEDRGTQPLKGVPEPTALFRLVRASGGGRRSGQRNLTPLVGRDDEMTMLLRRWERARQGDGQLVMIVGEPGLGKSRLIEEFHARLADTPHTWVEWSCSQLLQNTPLHPIAEWGRARFGGADVPAERRLVDLESSLAQVKLDPAENTSLLASLLDIPMPKESAPALAPEELRRRQLAALTNWVMAGARTQPLVLAFEDLHWADPTTLDVLRGIAERGALAPLCIVATTRPEFRPPWGIRSHHGTISLAPLDRAQVRDMVAELSARHALPRDVVEDVAARTGGVPLFVEEVTRLLLERGEGGGGIQAIPPTLQQSLMARLDRLGPAREVAQIGSVIGRGFSYALLRDVAGMEDVPLQAAVEKLAEADIVLVQGLPPESDYRFKHALIQDAAYENLLKSRRQVLHRRVAETLRDRFADTAAAEPEALAYHFTQAGLTDAAIEWWGKAGDQALRRSAFQEAISHLGKAIEIADKEGEGAPRAAATPATASVGQRLKLQTSYGQALMWSKGYASEETKAAVSRAQELAGNVDDPSERFATYYGQWAGHLLRAELNSALETATAFLRDAENAGRPTEAAVAQRFLGLTILWQSDFIEARARLNEALRIYDSERDHDAKFHFGTDTGAVATVHLAQANWLLGNVDQARELMQEAVTRAGATTHAPTVTNVDYFRAVFEVLRGDTGAALRTADSLLKLTRQHGLSVYATLGTMCSGWARAQLGDCEAGVAEFREALATYTGQGNKGHVPLHQGLLAELEADGQDMEAALTRMDAALALAGETGEHWTDSFLHRVRGEILLKRNPANTAPVEEALLTAIAIAQQQKAKSFELRAALSLANLYQSTGRAADAHAVLAPALEGFSPTPEFPEIEQAQTQLAALAETDEVKNAAAARQRRLTLQTSLANALLQTRGMQSPETQTAFSHARELAGGVDDPLQRFSSYYGLWVGHYVRGELTPMREIAELVLREVEARPVSFEAAVAFRLNGTTEWFAGNFAVAHSFLERALAVFNPQGHSDHAFRFAQHIGGSITAYLALVLWPLGEATRARTVAEQMMTRATQSGHASTIAYGHYHFAAFEMMRRGSAAAASHTERLVDVSRAHEMRMWMALGKFLAPWSRRSGDGSAGAVAEMRDGIATCREQAIGLFIPFFAALLAEAEGQASELDAALATIDGVIAEIEREGQHWCAAEAHRIRGEILLKRDPANTAPAEEALLTAIAIAQHQKARGFELRERLSLAKLYQLTDRPADAYAVLAPALEGFAPTPEFPEIAEAQALFETLTRSDEVKAVSAARQQRAKLHVALGNALIAARGYGAPETTAAFARASEAAALDKNAPEHLSALYGLWSGGHMRGELAAMREHAAAFLRDVERRPHSPEAGVAHRINGITRWFAGEFAEARGHYEKALAIFDPARDADLAYRFGQDAGVGAMAYRALALWPLGEVDSAVRSMEAAKARASELTHVGTIAYCKMHAAMFEMMRDDFARAAPLATALAELAREHDLKFWGACAAFVEGWTTTRDDLTAGRAQMRHGLDLLNIVAFEGLFKGAFAVAEARAGDYPAALATLDHAASVIERTGERWFDAELHRTRGEILVKQNPADPAPAEAAFLTAIAIAQQQKARSFELRAALSLAKLYQSTGRAGDAHAVLAPALEGFAPTPEFPEIAEAQQLLGSLGS
jgi:predicted ATPase